MRDVTCSLLGVTMKPLAQHGLCRMKCRQMWLEQKLQMSVMRVSLHRWHEWRPGIAFMTDTALGDSDLLVKSKVLRTADL